MNYRHQADACHAYQIMLKSGVPASNIILMMQDRCKLSFAPKVMTSCKRSISIGFELNICCCRVGPDSWMFLVAPSSLWGPSLTNKPPETSRLRSCAWRPHALKIHQNHLESRRLRRLRNSALKSADKQGIRLPGRCGKELYEPLPGTTLQQTWQCIA